MPTDTRLATHLWPQSALAYSYCITIRRFRGTPCPYSSSISTRISAHGRYYPARRPYCSPPAKGGVRFINNLALGLLSRIFKGGSADDAKDEDGDGDEEEEETDDEADKDGTRSSGDFTRPWLPFSIIAFHVCCHWRNVATSTPSLCTTIIVLARTRRPYELKSTQLERSQSLPIDV